MTNVFKKFLAVSIVSALALGAGAGATAANAAESDETSASITAAPTYASGTVSVEEMTKRIFDDTNRLRTRKGLAPLKRLDALDDVATAWSKHQAADGVMSHNPSYTTQIPSTWRFAAENVAYGYYYDEVVTAWKNSPGHYRNIMSDATHIGIGYYEANGERYFTQNFAKYSSGTKFLTEAPRPKLTGSTKVHKRLHATAGDWNPGAVHIKYRWFAGGKHIKGEYKSTLKISKKYKGKTIKVRVIGSKSGYAALVKTSASTAKVRR